MRAWIRTGMLAAVVLAAGWGCAPRQPAVSRVDGRNFGAFYYWRSSVSSQFTPAGWREFNNAIQELRLRAMIQGVTGTDAIDQAMCDMVNGHTIAEVLRLGDEARLKRLIPARDKLKTMVDANALLAARPGDDEVATALNDRRGHQEEELQRIIADIEATKRRYAANGGILKDVAVDPRPAVLPREEALNEWATLVARRREIAEERYGDWPARIDRAGADLFADDNTAFKKAREAAEYNGHTVIPVFIRAKWRIFDAVVQPPDFSEALVGNLTPADRREMANDWAESEAEIWARKQASEESVDTAVANIKSSLKGIMRP